jgi:thiol-disulfide isomerase/thioredoxin
MTIEKIDSKIDELTAKINNIEARPTEVYSRIVGYYRSVKNWNNGKSAEYKIRKTFMEPECQACQPPVVNIKPALEEEAPSKEEKTTVFEEKAAVQAVASSHGHSGNENQADLFVLVDTAEEPSPKSAQGSYSFFYRTTCPNCPPMKELISELSWEGKHINVDEEEGLNAAVEYNVFTAPTVILFNGEGEELFRTDNVAGLREYVEAETVATV